MLIRANNISITVLCQSSLVSFFLKRIRLQGTVNSRFESELTKQQETQFSEFLTKMNNNFIEKKRRRVSNEEDKKKCSNNLLITPSSKISTLKKVDLFFRKELSQRKDEICILSHNNVIF